MSKTAVTIHWTGILDWTTGLKFFSFFGQVFMFLNNIDYIQSGCLTGHQLQELAGCQ